MGPLRWVRQSAVFSLLKYFELLCFVFIYEALPQGPRFTVGRKSSGPAAWGGSGGPAAWGGYSSGAARVKTVLCKKWADSEVTANSFVFGLL